MKEEFETAKAWVEKYEFYRFEGEINVDKIKVILMEVDNHITSKDAESTPRTRASNTFVEVLLNISHQVNNDTAFHGFNSIITVSEFNNEYKIFAKGVIKNDLIEITKTPIDYLNEHIDNKEILKNLYKNVIRHLPSPITNLGFIDIVRKSRNKILYNFEKIDEEHSYFSVIATVKAAI